MVVYLNYNFIIIKSFLYDLIRRISYQKQHLIYSTIYIILKLL